MVTQEITGHTTIAISRQTKYTLDSIKHPGQSYDGLIQELAKFWEEKKDKYLTRREEQEVVASSV